MSKAGAAGRLFLFVTMAGLAACGPAPGARAPSAAQVLPASGPLPLGTLKRLLLVDGVRVGSRLVAVGDHGYIVLSDDEGARWRRAAAPVAPLLTAVVFAVAKRGWAVGHVATYLATADGGESWTRQFSAPAEHRPLLDVLFLDAAHGIAVGAYGAYYETADGGRTWGARKIIAEDRHFNAIVRVKGDRLLIIGEAGTLLASRDAGHTWTMVASPYKGSLFGGLVADDGSVLAYGLRGRIFRSSDGGDTWAPVDEVTTATLMGGARLPDGALAIAGSAGTVLLSRDAGRTFTAVARDTARAYATLIPGAPGEAMVLGEGGPREVKIPPAAAGTKP
jgi:photosystem II stability/assembly factor-like uncharacterized protein